LAAFALCRALVSHGFSFRLGAGDGADPFGPTPSGSVGEIYPRPVGGAVGAPAVPVPHALPGRPALPFPVLPGHCGRESDHCPDPGQCDEREHDQCPDDLPGGDGIPCQVEADGGDDDAAQQAETGPDTL